MRSPLFAATKNSSSRDVRALPRWIAASTLALIAAGAIAGSSCTSVDATGAGGTSAGGAGGSGGAVIPPGEVCDTPSPDQIHARFQPSEIFLPPCLGEPCARRKVRLVVDPDFCVDTKLKFETAASSDPDAHVPAPADVTIGMHHAYVDVDVVAGKETGVSTFTVNPLGGTNDPAKLVVHVTDGAAPACSGTASMASLAGGQTLLGKDGLVGASVGLQAGAEKPNSGSFLWHVDPFNAEMSCGEELTPKGYVKLGPAIKFGPEALTFHREIPLTIPLNPGLIPANARLRHVQVMYSGPGFKKPRPIPVADPRIESIGSPGQWALTFKAPRLGTYQAVVAIDAGSKSKKRKLTYRAALGISMGGGGTATFGMRHHDRFDVLAPLGGPVDWTWMLNYIENNHLGGFRPIAKGTKLADIPLTSTPCMTGADCKPDETCLGASVQKGRCVLMPVAKEPYLHPQTFNMWWYEYPKDGNGGTFARSDYSQIFRDLALQYGNPNGQNNTPGGENLPAGVPPTDKSVQGDHTMGECQVWVDPLDGPDHDKQQAIANSCPAERCAHTLTLQNYFDDEYNPDGTFPVITVCDGAQQDPMMTPYSNTWSPNGDNVPLEVGLAVDYNGNGVRDELEPIIRAGHERWYDDGDDATASANEPGYMAGVNDDPNGDDYDAQYNPSGTENDHRYEKGEKFDDNGLDGVPFTKQQPADGYKQPGDGYDVGEGDGQFTVTKGLQRFWDRDAHSIVRRWVDPALVPGGDLDDNAISRVDLWADGGTRDLFNFGVDAQHLVGAFAARGRHVTYMTELQNLPGLSQKMGPNVFLPAQIDWADLPGIVLNRYGHIDPTDMNIKEGSGQHVGTANEIASRLQSALYFAGSRWANPELRLHVEDSATKPAPNAPVCEVTGNCTFNFTSKSGRVGPVGVTLPPGYAHADLQSIRYPVIYVLHGYGQTPEDLEAAIVFLRNWMNSPTDSTATRLPKAILVYVDGRCRIGPTGKAECVRGTFFSDSARKEGAQDEQWWLELMDHMDQNFRTLGPSSVDWTE
jgi:hypothetical protein